MRFKRLFYAFQRYLSEVPFLLLMNLLSYLIQNLFNHKGKGMAMTKDVKDIGQMYLQYETSTACNHPKACNRELPQPHMVLLEF